jgi:HD-GYP domain-containing protein (c-di-GMP phosphodiesterase class II)
VNVFTALTSNRPYRKAISKEQAIAHLREQAASGAHNSELVERFIECLAQTNNSIPLAQLTSQDVEPAGE